jgi:hypothetical protein
MLHLTQDFPSVTDGLQNWLQSSSLPLYCVPWNVTLQLPPIALVPAPLALGLTVSSRMWQQWQWPSEPYFKVLACCCSLSGALSLQLQEQIGYVAEGQVAAPGIPTQTNLDLRAPKSTRAINGVNLPKKEGFPGTGGSCCAVTVTVPGKPGRSITPHLTHRWLGQEQIQLRSEELPCCPESVYCRPTTVWDVFVTQQKSNPYTLRIQCCYLRLYRL